MFHVKHVIYSYSKIFNIIRLIIVYMYIFSTMLLYDMGLLHIKYMKCQNAICLAISNHVNINKIFICLFVDFLMFHVKHSIIICIKNAK